MLFNFSADFKSLSSVKKAMVLGTGDLRSCFYYFESLRFMFCKIYAQVKHYFLSF